ncbi:hypothetical protein GU926_08140 [Nibribacter ruber]|uniref:Uncharacterized protein n=1 Tax=Nibribacter ruber TaxID=2698458 RepID=A0A6P1NZ69_9BACT|nr:hypothetical protein [Nibribacter ruber]QHL87405.1 hypothetical protein GU926_08140 [Nibribacter ruber]
MDIRGIYSVQVRKEGSDKVLIYVDGLTEPESNKVFEKLKFAKNGDGYEKLIVVENGDEQLVLRRRSLK